MERIQEIDRFFIILFILLFSALSLLRLYFKIKFKVLPSKPFSAEEGILPVILRILLGIPLLYFVAGYIFFPLSHSWAYMQLSPVLRSIGAVCGFSALFFLYYVHRTLGNQFSTTLLVRKGHRLIKNGPYRFIRHPMYSAYFCLFLSAFCITEHWLIGLLGMSIILLLMTLRLKKEEALLLRTFGVEYSAYMQQTGRFVPLIRRRVKQLYRSALSRCDEQPPAPGPYRK
jgi:protein-S-isoprenylcysteine O-methyltransferase Ste14